MTQPKILLLLVIACVPTQVWSQQQPYFFNYQPQHHQPQYQQTGTYQPFSNSPLGSFFQPPSGQSGSSDIYGNYFNDGLTRPTQSTIAYPTQVSTITGQPTASSPSAEQHNLISYQPFAPLGNSLQQTPTQSSPTVSTDSQGFKPSIPFFNHHTHIVNGLPRQQFFGNNYDFFRTRHNIQTFPDPLYQGHGISTAAPPQPSSTPYISSTASPVSFSAANATTPKYIVQPRLKVQPTATSSPLFANFPSFSTAKSISSDFDHTVKPLASYATPTSNSLLSTGTPSSAFTISQDYPERDSSLKTNQLPRQPLFGEEEEDDDVYRGTNGNSLSSFSSKPSFQTTRSPTYATNDLTLPRKPVAESSPVKVHNTTPIRIVFNYEQALEALQENPGVRVVISHTDKPEEDDTTAFPPTTRVTATTPRSYSTPIIYQPTTSRPSSPSSFRPSPLISSSVVPSTTPRYTYSPVNVPYTTQEDEYGTTGAALENLALDLEGNTGSRGVASARPIYASVATPTSTLSPFKTFQRGSKKYVVVPSADNLYKDPEPRVVVNDLANIYVGPSTGRAVTPTSSSLSTYTFPKFKTSNPTKKPVTENLRQEIDILNEELHQQRITSASPTPTTFRYPSSTVSYHRPAERKPAPAILSVTTYRPPFDQGPRQYEDNIDDDIDEAPVTTRTTTRITTPSPVEVLNSQSPRYYYNDKSRGGVIAGTRQRYGHNDLDNENPPVKKKVLRRQRPRPRLTTSSPTFQAPTTKGTAVPLGPVVEEGLPSQLHLGPVLNPVPVGIPSGGQVLRVGPRGRLLRRKSRPRQPGQPQPAQQGFSTVEPSPTPSFVSTSEPFVTTFRPVQNVLVQQSPETNDDRPAPFQPRFRFQPARQNAADDDDDSEEAPAPVPQRRRPNFSTTTTTERSTDSGPVVASDRANILQRQIRFRNRQKTQRNN